MNQKNIGIILTVIMVLGICKAQELDQYINSTQGSDKHVQCPEIEGLKSNASCQYSFVDSEDYNFNKEFGLGACCMRSSVYKSELDAFQQVYKNFESKCKELETMNSFIGTTVKLENEKSIEKGLRKIRGSKDIVWCEIVFNQSPYASKILKVNGPRFKRPSQIRRVNGKSHICTD